MDDNSNDYYDEWVKEYLAPRFPELVAPFLEARSLYEQALNTGTIDQSDAERLLSHARNSRTPLGENAAVMLGELYASIPALGWMIRNLATGKHRHERVNALVALHSSPPTDLHLELFELLLRDKSARVRTLAADKIVIYKFKQLAHALDVAIGRETDTNVANELKADLDYLLQGFHVEHQGTDVCITCRITSERSVSKIFSLEEYETEGRAWLREQLGDAG